MAITCVSKFQIRNGAITLNMYTSKPFQSLNKAQFGQGMVPKCFFENQTIMKLQLLRQENLENPLRECWELILKGMTCI